MDLQPLPGFRSFATHHCVTGSLRHVFAYHGHDVSEEMLLGLGAGVGFTYWHQKGQPPFIGGRGGFKPPLEETAAARSGVVATRHTSTSAKRARQSLLDLLAAGEPVMLMVDMGYLPYFDFHGQDYHFGAHAVVACGYDKESDQVLIADRDGLHSVPMADLERARGSTYQPFPPGNLWFTFDFSGKRPPTADAVRQAIAEMAQAMLHPPIANLGVAGMRTAAQRIPRWPSILDMETLRTSLLNAYIMLSSIGGSGGGNFRYMLSRFLREAAVVVGEPLLVESADEFQQIADRWQALAEWFRRVSKAPEPAACLGECQASLFEIAAQEQAAWERCADIARRTR